MRRILAAGGMGCFAAPRQCERVYGVGGFWLKNRFFTIFTDRFRREPYTLLKCGFDTRYATRSRFQLKTVVKEMARGSVHVDDKR